MNSFRTLAALAWFAGALTGADLRNAVILVPAAAPGPEQKAAQMLTEEIAKRTQIRLEVTHAAPAAGRPVIALGTAAESGRARRGCPRPRPAPMGTA